MKGKFNIIILSLVVIIIIIIISFGLWRQFGKQQAKTVTNFEECANAGNPVVESYPRQCRYNNQTFVEDIGNELEKLDLIRIDFPRPNEAISSPLIIKGVARGNWFFEASFPVFMTGWDGQIIAQGIATAKSDWMTEDFVPFESLLTFSVSKNQKGTLVLEKDNPSGLPENADELKIPVRLSVAETPAGQLRTVKLYYYNPNLDKDSSGNIMCSRQGLVAIEREIPITNTPIQDTIKLLISGNLTNEEKVQGVTTEYPLQGLSLAAASLNNGALTLTFSDSYNKTGGGSCRVGILWFQVEATAKQFPGISSVRFMPEELFQP